jgi:hypothetical protein
MDAAHMSARRVVAAKEAEAANPDQPDENLVWTTALADVVMDDRAERVGASSTLARRSRPTETPLSALSTSSNVRALLGDTFAC